MFVQIAISLRDLDDLTAEPSAGIVSLSQHANLVFLSCPYSGFLPGCCWPIPIQKLVRRLKNEPVATFRKKLNISRLMISNETNPKLTVKLTPGPGDTAQLLECLSSVSCFLPLEETGCGCPYL